MIKKILIDDLLRAAGKDPEQYLKEVRDVILEC